MVRVPSHTGTLPTPTTVLAGLGFCLVVLGLSAWARSRTTDEEAAIVERALRRLAPEKMLELPGKILSSLVNAVVSLITLPFRLIRNGFGYAGTWTGRAVSTAAAALARLPSTLVQAVSRLFVSLGRSTTNGLSRLWRGVLSIMGYHAFLELCDRSWIATGDYLGLAWITAIDSFVELGRVMSFHTSQTIQFTYLYVSNRAEVILATSMTFFGDRINASVLAFEKSAMVESTLKQWNELGRQVETASLKGTKAVAVAMERLERLYETLLTRLYRGKQK